MEGSSRILEENRRTEGRVEYPFPVGWIVLLAWLPYGWERMWMKPRPGFAFSGGFILFPGPGVAGQGEVASLYVKGTTPGFPSSQNLHPQERAA